MNSEEGQIVESYKISFLFIEAYLQRQNKLITFECGAIYGELINICLSKAEIVEKGSICLLNTSDYEHQGENQNPIHFNVYISFIIAKSNFVNQIKTSTNKPLNNYY